MRGLSRRWRRASSAALTIRGGLQDERVHAFGPTGRPPRGGRQRRLHSLPRAPPIDWLAHTTDSGGLDMRGMRACAVLALALFALLPGVAAAKPKHHDQHVQVLAINDLHGNIEPPS